MLFFQALSIHQGNTGNCCAYSSLFSFRGRVAGTKGMSEDEAMKMFTARQPTGRFCSKEEVANLALYLGKILLQASIVDRLTRSLLCDVFEVEEMG